MSEYTDELLKLERLRNKLYMLEKEKGLDVEETESLASLIDKAADINLKYKDEFANTVNAFSDAEPYEINDTEGLVKSLRNYAFYGCQTLKSIILPKLTTAGYDVFNGCSELREAVFPNLVSANNRFLNNCQKLKKVYAPKVTSVGSNFISNSQIEFLQLKLTAWADSDAFLNNKLLKTVALPHIARFDRSTEFSGCISLKTLVLYNNGVVSLSNLNNFTNTPFHPTTGEGGGEVFVPRDWVESYKTATNWSTMYTAGKINFLPAEDNREYLESLGVDCYFLD